MQDVEPLRFLASKQRGDNWIDDGLDRSIDARICRLRRKLQDAGGAETMIKTVRLKGYLFTGDA